MQNKKHIFGFIVIAILVILIFVFILLLSNGGLMDNNKGQIEDEDLTRYENICKNGDFTENDDYVESDLYRVVSIDYPEEIEEQILLLDNELVVYDHNCKYVKSIEPELDKLNGANAINSLTLIMDVLVVNYHVNPDISVIRRYEINSSKDDFFIGHYSNGNNEGGDYPLFYSKLLHTDKIINYNNQEYGFNFDYMNRFELEDLGRMNNSSAYVVSVTDEVCSINCVELHRQNVFTVEVYDSIFKLPSYKNEVDLEDYINNNFRIDVDGEFVREFPISGKNISGYYVKSYKEVGVVALFTNVLIEKDDKVFWISSNMPGLTSKLYEAEFEEILESFGYL